MPAEHIEILVEEPSAEAALRLLIPKISDRLSFGIYVHPSKTYLLDKLQSRLRGYANSLPDAWKVFVLIDRDDDDCHALKLTLTEAARRAGFNAPHGRRAAERVVTRIAIEELEAWFFGDWQAVVAAYPRVNPHVTAKSGYREPDRIAGGTWEALERVLRAAGYFKGGLRKIEAARAIAAHMVPERNCSPSFQAFRGAVIAA